MVSSFVSFLGGTFFCPLANGEGLGAPRRGADRMDHLRRGLHPQSWHLFPCFRLVVWSCAPNTTVTLPLESAVHTLIGWSASLAFACAFISLETRCLRWAVWVP